MLLSAQLPVTHASVECTGIPTAPGSYEGLAANDPDVSCQDAMIIAPAGNEVMPETYVQNVQFSATVEPASMVPVTGSR